MSSTHCPACGDTNQNAEAQFCSNCGANLAGREPSASTPPPVEPGAGSAVVVGGGGGGDAGGDAGGGAGGGAGGLPPSPGGSSVPFEDSTRPFFGRFFSTVGMAFSRPVQMFSDMPADNIGAPVLYGVLIGSLGGVFAILWQVLIGGIGMLAENAGGEELAVSTGILVLFMFLMPIFVVVGLFISAGIYHLMLMLVGDGQRGFGITLRAVCYGQTPNLLAILPICGGFVGGIWSMVLIIMAAIYGHRTDGWRAILAYFLPTLVCCCLLFWLLSMTGFIGALSAQ